MFSWRLTLASGALAATLLLGAAAVLFQDNITRFLINPRTPYQTYTPPPPPAYGARGAWALWPDDQSAGSVDVFYVHSTTYASGAHWNAPLRDSAADAALRRVAAPNEAGPFMRVGAVYGPRYRQATLFTAFTHKFDGLAARELAYRDVEQAFLQFLRDRPTNRPIILAGYGQGGLHVLGLLTYHVAENPALKSKLAAAYIIGASVPLSLFDAELTAARPCFSPEETGCVVAYIDIGPGFEEERRRFRQRSLIWTQERTLRSHPRSPLTCVNPILGEVSEDVGPRERHAGAASATGLRIRETPPAISKAVSAQCVNGILEVDRPQQIFLRRRHWFGRHWKPQNFNLFYHDLAEDAARRVRNLELVLEARAVDLESSPDDKGAD